MLTEEHTGTGSRKLQTGSTYPSNQLHFSHKHKQKKLH